MKYKECPDCGAALDHGEVCKCRDKENEGAPAATGTPSSGNNGDCNSASTLSDPYRDVNQLERVKDLLEDIGAMDKDVALVVRDMFPKFNRQLLSQCKNWKDYGIILHPNGLRAICNAYHQQLPRTPARGVPTDAEVPPKKPENRKLCRKLAFRITTDDFEVLQQRIRRDGYETMQDWLYAQIIDLLKEDANA
ncbi:MAG: hypothetical protein IJ955_09130 [Oscillospiraceae bacterium]|nr:hypothetical protein [Oscillospiraceae bacterium]